MPEPSFAEQGIHLPPPQQPLCPPTTPTLHSEQLDTTVSTYFSICLFTRPVPIGANAPIFLLLWITQLHRFRPRNQPYSQGSFLSQPLPTQSLAAPILAFNSLHPYLDSKPRRPSRRNNWFFLNRSVATQEGGRVHTSLFPDTQAFTNHGALYYGHDEVRMQETHE